MYYRRVGRAEKIGTIRHYVYYESCDRLAFAASIKRHTTMSSLDPPVSLEPSTARRIMSADIAGYSRMVGRDEEGTVALVTSNLPKSQGRS